MQSDNIDNIEGAISLLNDVLQKRDMHDDWYIKYGSTFLLCAIDRIKDELKILKKYNQKKK